MSPFYCLAAVLPSRGPALLRLYPSALFRQASLDEIVAEVIAAVRDEIGPVASFKLCAVVDRLPKTRSGKILRGTMRSIADGEPWNMPATIDDAESLDDVTLALQSLGYAVTTVV